MEVGHLRLKDFNYDSIYKTEEVNMRMITETPKTSAQEPVTQDWLRYELTEDDFLVGKKPEFSPDLWEDEE